MEMECPIKKKSSISKIPVTSTVSTYRPSQKNMRILGNPDRSSTIASNSFKCFPGFRNIITYCLNRKLITLAEGESCKEEEKENQPIKRDKEETVHADQGEALVVNRSLSTIVVVDEEDWLWHNIFHIECTSQGKKKMEALAINQQKSNGTLVSSSSVSSASKLVLFPCLHPRKSRKAPKWSL